MSELCLFIQNNGTSCQCKATFSVPGQTKKYCGRHKDKALTAPVASAPPEATGTQNETIKSVIEMKLTKENKTKKNKAVEIIYNCIMETIVNTNSGYLSEEDRSIISLSLPKLDNQVFNLIIKNSVIESGATTEQFDYLEIAKKIPEKYIGYTRAISLQSGNITTFISFDPKRENCRLCKVPPKMFVNDDGTLQGRACLYYPKADVRILNFKFVNRQMLFGNVGNFEGSDEIVEFKKYEAIDMSSDEQMFIPRDYKYLTREEQNPNDVSRIMTMIKEGKEDPKKYLALKGKTLCCDCLPECCHCEVYVAVIENLI